MGDLRDDRTDQRFVQDFEGEPSLRGSGAAGRFMQALADHARQDGLKLVPRCSYAVAWFRRHADYADVLA